MSIVEHTWGNARRKEANRVTDGRCGSRVAGARPNRQKTTNKKYFAREEGKGREVILITGTHTGHVVGSKPPIKTKQKGAQSNK